eukprot:jgi/Mesen1/8590/ME000005S08555
MSHVFAVGWTDLTLGLHNQLGPLNKPNSTAIIEDRIPVDGRVRGGRSTVDEFSLTGEPLPVLKGPGVSTAPSCTAPVARVTTSPPAATCHRLHRRLSPPPLPPVTASIATCRCIPRHLLPPPCAHARPATLSIVASLQAMSAAVPTSTRSASYRHLFPCIHLPPPPASPPQLPPSHTVTL